VNNTQRIIDALRLHAGLDDDELSRQTGVQPRQQVNQICRRLEARDVLSRVRGQEGKILNVLKETAQVENPLGTGYREAQNSIWHLESPPAREITNWTLGTFHRQSTLFVLCCSGGKSPDSLAANGPSILDYLPESLINGLREARRVVAPLAKLDESTLLPAWRRYSDQFYQASAQVIGRAVRQRVNVVIISGGEDVWLLTPERSQGAMVKSPRAQGEAFVALFDTGLTDSWRSSDGLTIDGTRLA
jgi:hypothetical protein